MSHTRRIVVSEFLSLDGVMQDPAWTAPYWNDQIAAFKGEETDAADLLLLGRVTYEMFAAHWPSSTDEAADQINALGKVVVTDTLTQADLDRDGWNAAVLDGGVPDGIRHLKQRPGGDLLVWGSGHLARALLHHRLVDELRLIVYPLLLGTGQRLFSGQQHAAFTRAESHAFRSGATALVLHPAENA
ncbi:MAG: dihydrofolate reductase family protein [Rubricoccaceae bacterium]|nr:dihydrofolate reductase family protein [Rubricoccaceae bacterium]